MSQNRVVHDQNNPYTTINTSIVFDNTVSGLGKALWLYAFSRPNDWEFYTCEMEKHFMEKETAIATALKTLEKAGYLERHQERLSNGRMGAVTWIWHENLKNKVPDRGFPAPVKPAPGKRPLLTNKQEPSIEKNNNNPPKPAVPKGKKKKPSAVVVFSILNELGISEKLKKKISSEHDEQKVIQLIKRVKAWKGRESDAKACNTILGQWDTWEDKKPIEEIKQENELWLDSKGWLDSSTHKNTQIIVGNGYIDFVYGELGDRPPYRLKSCNPKMIEMAKDELLRLGIDAA